MCEASRGGGKARTRSLSNKMARGYSHERILEDSLPHSQVQENRSEGEGDQDPSTGYRDPIPHYFLCEDLRDSTRCARIFHNMDKFPAVLSYSLPFPNSLPSRVLQHAGRSFLAFYNTNKPTGFKFGVTRDPCSRWFSKKGYHGHFKHRWQGLRILYVAGNPHGPAFLEASLVQRFGGRSVAMVGHYIEAVAF